MDVAGSGSLDSTTNGRYATVRLIGVNVVH